MTRHPDVQWGVVFGIGFGALVLLALWLVDWRVMLVAWAALALLAWWAVARRS